MLGLPQSLLSIYVGPEALVSWGFRLHSCTFGWVLRRRYAGPSPIATVGDFGIPF